MKGLNGAGWIWPYWLWEACVKSNSQQRSASCSVGLMTRDNCIALRCILFIIFLSFKFPSRENCRDEIYALEKADGEEEDEAFPLAALMIIIIIIIIIIAIIIIIVILNWRKVSPVCKRVVTCWHFCPFPPLLLPFFAHVQHERVRVHSLLLCMLLPLLLSFHAAMAQGSRARRRRRRRR